MSTLLLKNLKPNDWITCINEYGFMEIRQVKTDFMSYNREHSCRIINSTLTQDIIKLYDYKYLIIKPVALLEGTIIIYNEKWMFSALEWASKRIKKDITYGKKTRLGTLCTAFDHETSVSISAYLKNSDYTEIDFWDAVCGEDNVDVHNNEKEKM